MGGRHEEVFGEHKRMKLLISWTTVNNGITVGGHKLVEDWTDIRRQLEQLRVDAGTVCLELMDALDTGPVSMDVAAEKGSYLVTLLEATEDDTQVRSYSNPARCAEMVEVLGDCWDARQLTSDFDLVLKMFKEFFQTGNVSEQWLS